MELLDLNPALPRLAARPSPPLQGGRHGVPVPACSLRCRGGVCNGSAPPRLVPVPSPSVAAAPRRMVGPQPDPQLQGGRPVEAVPAPPLRGVYPHDPQ